MKYIYNELFNRISANCAWEKCALMLTTVNRWQQS